MKFMIGKAWIVTWVFVTSFYFETGVMLAREDPLPVKRSEPDKSGRVDDYSQWKQALGAQAATDANKIDTLPGFQIERLRSAGNREGSWINLAFDPQGRLVIALEKKGLLRITLSKKERKPERIEVVNDSLLECRGLLFAYDALYVNANNSKGFYRLRDTTGYGGYDEVKLLRSMPGGVGHGRNNLTLGPDGRIYMVCGNDVLLPKDYVVRNSPFRHYAVDRVLPCSWDSSLFNAGVKPPAGHLIRTDRDGRTWELVAGGFRNPYGIDFNADGEMFTFDADMEWDQGAPWYRPTRVNHIVSGGDYGWRQGTGKWPAWYPDSLPSTLDLGLSSPTAVKSGLKSNFPRKYRNALYVLDWAYGRIIAVHTTPQGASYTCTSETFVKGRPLNVTGVDFGPDGAMYFVTGGRGTQSGLYRVRYVGKASQKNQSTLNQTETDKTAVHARILRRKLEAFHGHEHPHAVTTAWLHLNSTDPWIRHAARIAIERQPASLWQERAFTERRPTAQLTALMALARVGNKALQPRIFQELAEVSWDDLSDPQKHIAVRTYALCFIRMGRPDQKAIELVGRRLDEVCPDKSPQVNMLLCELLVFLQVDQAVAKTMSLLASASTQEEKLHYLFVLRHAKTGWSVPQRKSYFRWLAQADHFDGARYMPTFIANIKNDAIAHVPEDQREQFEKLLKKEAMLEETQPESVDRPFVRAWKMDDLYGSLEAVGRRRSFERGKQMFTVALCNRCHAMGKPGKTIGPDLTAVARRFSRRDMLESMLAPSKVVGEKFRNVMIETTDGRVVVGSIIAADSKALTVLPNPLDPKSTVRVPKDKIGLQQQSLVSPMPPGALNTLTKEEILDLLAYLEAAGDPKHSNFQGPRAEKK